MRHAARLLRAARRPLTATLSATHPARAALRATPAAVPQSYESQNGRRQGVRVRGVRRYAAAASADFAVPPMGDSITEGTVIEWLKQPGEAVAVDETFCVIETDKPVMIPQTSPE